MKIIDYDNETCAILVRKRQLESAGFLQGDDVYVVALENGMLAVIRKSSFRAHLKEKVRSSLELPETPPIQLGADDIALLRKITSVKFEERIPENVLRMLSESEMETLRSLVDRGIIRVYKGGKYKGKGVYTIPRDVYGLACQHLKGGLGEDKVVGCVQETGKPRVQESETAKPSSAKMPIQPALVSEMPAPDYRQVADVIKALEKDGFVVISNDELARTVSTVLREKIKKNSIMGMKGFDGKYYVMTSRKYHEAESLIRAYLTENRRATLAELSKSLGLEESVCRGVMNFLLENGDAIEKSRGKYELV